MGKEDWAHYRKSFRDSSTRPNFVLPTLGAACWKQLLSSAHIFALHLSQVSLITSSARQSTLGLLLAFTDTMFNL